MNLKFPQIYIWKHEVDLFQRLFGYFFPTRMKDSILNYDLHNRSVQCSSQSELHSCICNQCYGWMHMEFCSFFMCFHWKVYDVESQTQYHNLYFESIWRAFSTYVWKGDRGKTQNTSIFKQCVIIPPALYSINLKCGELYSCERY